MKYMLHNKNTQTLHSTVQFLCWYSYLLWCLYLMGTREQALHWDQRCPAGTWRPHPQSVILLLLVIMLLAIIWIETKDVTALKREALPLYYLRQGTEEMMHVYISYRCICHGDRIYAKYQSLPKTHTLINHMNQYNRRRPDFYKMPPCTFLTDIFFNILKYALS